MKKQIATFLTFLIVFSQGVSVFAQTSKNKQQGNFANDNTRTTATGLNPAISKQLKNCLGNMVSERVFTEYGAVYGANVRKVVLPSVCYFKNEAEVREFQQRAGIAAENVNGFRIELQPQALKAFLSARAEAIKLRLEISPRAGDSSRRSYAETSGLWRGQVEEGLNFWVGKGKITKKDSTRIRSLSLDRQTAEVLRLEAKSIYFGNGFNKSILQSVAVPGASQHNLMLALDIEQNSNPKVREILAKYGWFQTVKNDTPHFTYLGVKESELASLGLVREFSGGRKYWTVDDQAVSIFLLEKIADDVVGSTKPGRPRIVVPKYEDDESEDFLELPSENIPATVSSNVLLPLTIRPLLSELTRKYFRRTGRRLHITSGYRPPERQARAMYNNLINYGTRYVLRTYRGSSAARDIIDVYRKNPMDAEKTIAEMAKVIQSQIRRKIYISNHLLEKAFDIRSRGAEAAKFSTLSEIVASMGGDALAETDHYHVEFRRLNR